MPCRNSRKFSTIAVLAPPLYALAHLGVARAYAQEGQKHKARIAYQDFLALWKDADAGISIFKQAQAGFAKVQ